MVEGGRVVIELGLGEGRALADGHRGQIDAVGDVAHRPDALHIGLREVINHDRPILDGHASGLQTQALHIGRPAQGEEHHVGLHGRAVG